MTRGLTRGHRFHVLVRRRGRWVVRMLPVYRGIPLYVTRSMRT